MGRRFLPDGGFVDSRGRTWHPTIVRATQHNRDFYLRSAGHSSASPYLTYPGYVQMLLGLASTYARMGWTESAANTRDDADDLKFILGVT